MTYFCIHIDGNIHIYIYTIRMCVSLLVYTDACHHTPPVRGPRPTVKEPYVSDKPCRRRVEYSRLEEVVIRTWDDLCWFYPASLGVEVEGQ